MVEKATLNEAGKRAAALYEGGIRQQVEADHRGEYLVLNLETGEYVLGTDRLQVSDEAERAFPGTLRFLMRVGYSAAIRVGHAA